MCGYAAWTGQAGSIARPFRSDLEAPATSPGLGGVYENVQVKIGCCRRRLAMDVAATVSNVCLQKYAPSLSVRRHRPLRAVSHQGPIALPATSYILQRMELTYPINFVGHDEWLKSGYASDLATGKVVTRDGEVLGTWRAVGCDSQAEDEGGRYELFVDGQDAIMFAEGLAALDYRTSRGLALSTVARAIMEWHEASYSPTLGQFSRISELLPAPANRYRRC